MTTTLPVIAGQPLTPQVWMALNEVIAALGMMGELQPADATRSRPDGLPVLLLGKPPTADTIEVGVDIMTILERENRVLVNGPSVKEIMHSPAGLERLRRAVRLWDMTRRDELADPVFQYNLIEPSPDPMTPPIGLANLVQMTPGHDYLIVDIETSGDIKKDEPEDTELLCVSVLWPANSAHSEDIIHVWTYEALQDDRCLQALAQVLHSDVRLVGHNLQFDVKWLNNKLNAAMNWDRKVYPEDHDTFTLHYVLFPGATGDHGLKALAQKLLGAPEWEKEIKQYTRGGAHYELIPKNLLYSYNAADVYWTQQLLKLLRSWLAEAPECVRKVYEFELRNIRMLVDMEDTQAGWPVDMAKLEALRDELTPLVSKHLAKLRMMVGDPSPYLSEANAAQRKRYIELGKALGPQHDFNPGSWQQVQKWLRAQGVPCEGTSEKALNELIETLQTTPKATKFIKRLIEYRHTSKMLSTYVHGVIDSVRDGRTRPRFGYTTVTGRRTSWIHTIPRPTPGELAFREPYTVDPGEVLVHADYGQIELRIVAEICGDPQLIEDLQEGKPDFFAQLLPGAFPRLFRSLDDVWEMKENDPGQYKARRNTIKPFSHGLNYGRKAAAIAKQFKLPLHEAQQITNAYLRRYPGITRWHNEIMLYVEGKKLSPYWGIPGLWTRFGRRFQQGVIFDENEWTIKNQALAFEPQSTGSDVCQTAAMDLHENRLHMFGARIVNSQHDSIDVIAPEQHAEEVSKAMVKIMRRSAEKVFDRVPFIIDTHIGKDWNEVSA